MLLYNIKLSYPEEGKRGWNELCLMLERLYDILRISAEAVTGNWKWTKLWNMTGRAISYFPALSNHIEESTWSNQE